MGDVLTFTGFTHAITLDRLREDHGGLILGPHGFRISGVHLVWIMTAAVQTPDVVIGHVGDHLGKLRVFAEEIVAGVGAAFLLEVLILAVHRFFHALAQQTLGVAVEFNGSQYEPQMTLMTRQPAPRKTPSSS